MRSLLATSRLLLSVFLLALLMFSGAEADSIKHAAPVHYDVTFSPKSRSAEVAISIAKAGHISSVEFGALPNGFRWLDGNGELHQNDQAWRWTPPKTNAKLTYSVDLKTEKIGGGYDALITDNWSICRGEDLFPAFKAKKKKGYGSSTDITFHLPSHWQAVNSGWIRVDGSTFSLGDDARALVRPSGWLIAGDLGTRHESMGKTQISISAPKGHDFRQMETLAFVNMLWPEIQQVFESVPEKILITGAGDPMWRGGLSSPTSLFMHADRPLVSENGTSTLVHELIHVITGIHGDRTSDWIVEGLAEYYSVEVLYRAGAYSTERRQSIFNGLAEWGAGVSSLRKKRSSGAITARAAVLFDELNNEIQQCTDKHKNIDWVVRSLLGNKSVGLADLKAAYRAVCEKESKVLNHKLVSKPK